MSDCDFFARHGIDLHAADLYPAAKDLRDPRIKFAVVIDPGIVETLTDPSLAAIDLPMLVLNLGDEALVPAPVHARALSETVPGAEYRIVPDATHFSFLAECKPRGAQILIDEGEADPLCTDAGGRQRADIHAELADVILGFLNGLPLPQHSMTISSCEWASIRSATFNSRFDRACGDMAPQPGAAFQAACTARSISLALERGNSAISSPLMGE
jgi:hypothetical protein